MRVDAFSPESAAVKWAERDDADSADYLIVRGNDATVLVAEDRDGAPEHRFIVSGESCPVYRARQLIWPPNPAELKGEGAT